MLTGENGILTQAQRAKTETSNAQEDELRRIIDSLGIKYTYKFIEDINHKIRFLKMEKNIWKLRY